MYDESVMSFSAACTATSHDDWSVGAEELPCLLDLRVTTVAGRLLPRLQGLIALGLAV